MHSVTALSIRPHLQSCGYSLLRNDFPLTSELSIPLVAFSSPPADARSACIAVLEDASGDSSSILAVRGLGAPIIFRCQPDGLEWWKQTSGEGPERIGARIPPADVPKFFGTHRNDFSPNKVYRAKTWGRFNKEHQLSFVDLGLMPLVEEEIGERLVDLIVRNVDRLKSTLHWEVLNEAKSEWLLKSVFWLVSAKLLRDKSVGKFSSLDLLDIDSVFANVATHFGTQGIEIGGEHNRGALTDLAHDVARFSSLELATTESLAYVYENTLTSKATRKALGTHSTPAFLVDYIVGRLGKHIEAIDQVERNVFEPACGHAAFLVSAMRYLTELLPEAQRKPDQRRSYLRKRMHGLDTDTFALEIARLSLSLTDIPNPNGWDVAESDIFIGDTLEENSRKATILLANPPFENFTDEERQWYASKGVLLKQANKTSEVFRRVLPELPVGAAIGLVAPQGILHSRDAESLRQIILNNFDLTEIVLFPDKVFQKADSEAVIILGVRRNKGSRSNTLTYSRVRENDYEAFQSSYTASFQQTVGQEVFVARESHNMRFAELDDVWRFCEGCDKIESIANLGQGFQFKGEHLPRRAKTYAVEEFDGACRAFIHFDVEFIHKLPTEYWANLDDDVIRRPGSGTTTGIAQILVNYAPVSRGPWRLKALLDLQGHAVSSRFIAVRPLDEETPLEFLWALLNSPLANAYAYSHLMKRDVLVGEMRRLPAPKKWQEHAIIVDRVKEYFDLLRNGTRPNQEATRKCLLRIDAAVLELYEFPASVERQVIDLFFGFQRPGVPFEQNEYIPRSFREELSLGDYLDITDAWPQVNRRRDTLIRKKVNKTISSEEKPELARLQQLAAYRQRLIDPLPIEELERISKALSRQT
jgi:hypothetical protein